MSDDEELLINTRLRRSNAGSRLKLLLEIEQQQQEEIAQSFTTEDDENVNLLFQEDEDDIEYSEEESSDEGEQEEGDEGDDEDNNGEEGEDSKPSKKRRRAEDSDEDEPLVNDDDVFTDSDEESEYSDAEEGEKELQLAERAKRRAKLKKSRLHEVPRIKQVKTNPEKSRKKPSAIDASSLLDDNRRSSSRRAVVENKLATVEKLKQLEERRKLNRPKERVQRHEMTQEERLAEAVETEKLNILSLNRFKEQELSKKERQRMLQQSRKKKLTNVIRFISYPHYVTPVEEFEQEKKLKEFLESRREKRGRRKRSVEDEKKKEVMLVGQANAASNDEEEKPDLQTNGDVKLENGEELVSDEKKDDIKVEDGTTVGEVVDTKELSDAKIFEPALENSESTEAGKESVSAEVSGEELSEVNVKAEVKNSDDSKIDNEEASITKDEQSKDEYKDEVEAEEEESAEIVETTEAFVSETLSEVPETETNEATADSMDVDESSDVKAEDVTKDSDVSKLEETIGEIKAEDAPSVSKENSDSMDVDEVSDVKMERSESKKVTFATEQQVILISETNEITVSTEDADIVKEDEDEDIEEVAEEKYEGPEQLVSRNYVLFEDFSMDPKVATIKEILFGSQSLLPAHRRSNDVEPIVRIRAKTEDDDLEQNLFKSVKDLKKQQFKDFYNLPKFGDDLSALNIDNEEDEEEEVKEVKIKTQAPIGIYLPNGMKKKCLITGKESQYFDPKSGLPYSSVEAYRVLQLVQNGEFSWCQFSSTGGVYMHDRNLKPASQCPERF